MASEVIKLNLIPKGEMPVFHCSQFDNGRLITIELYRGEDAYEVPSGYTCELHCRKVDGNIVTLASTLVNTNVVTFTSTTQLTACNGKNMCEVAIKAADDYLIGTLNFWLEVEIDPLKGGINSTSEIHDLYEQIEEITEEVIGDNYYNKTEVDDILDAKADVATTYTKTEVDTLLTSKADTSSVYTKSETNTLLAAKADASDVYTKSQVETKLAAKADAADVYTKTETDTLLDAKANANGVYSKVEVDGMVDDLEDAIDLKADAATTYTKTEVDTALALKADASNVYTKTETDTLLSSKANAADVYTKTQVDNIILDIMPVDTATGSPATFTTAIATDLVDVTTAITATGGYSEGTPAPIVGYSSAVITANGTDYTTSLGDTYYGGTLDVTTGVMTVTHNIVDMGSISWSRWDGDTTNHTFATLLNDRAFNTHDCLCSEYAVLDSTAAVWVTILSYDDTIFFPYNNSSAVLVRDEDYSDKDVFKTAMTGKKLVYPIATPTTVQLSSTVIAAIAGSNSVGSNTGAVTVRFKDSIQNYIDRRVTP